MSGSFRDFVPEFRFLAEMFALQRPDDGDGLHHRGLAWPVRDAIARKRSDLTLSDEFDGQLAILLDQLDVLSPDSGPEAFTSLGVEFLAPLLRHFDVPNDLLRSASHDCVASLSEIADELNDDAFESAILVARSHLSRLMRMQLNSYSATLSLIHISEPTRPY